MLSYEFYKWFAIDAVDWVITDVLQGACYSQIKTQTEAVGEAADVNKLSPSSVSSFLSLQL